MVSPITPSGTAEEVGYFGSKLVQVGGVGITLFFTVVIGILVCGTFLLTKRSKLTMAIAKSTHSAYGHLLLAGIGIFWASSVSVFGSKLQEQWFEGEAWGLENLLFGIPVTAALVLSVLHFIYSQHKEQMSHSRPSHDAINENSNQCVNMIGVVNGCVQDLRKIVQSEIASSGSVLGNGRVVNRYSETLDNAIETALESVLLVTRSFIEGNDEVHIKSNIFNLIPSQAVLRSFIIDESHKQENNSIFGKGSVENSPFFLFSTNIQSRLEHCDYILVCEQTFTCELNKKNVFSNCYKSHKDNFMDSHPICMPLSFDESNGVNKLLQHPNLFGAPEAVLTEREVYIGNLSERVDEYVKMLRKSPKYREYITGHYEQSIRRYYEKDKDKPKSILSIPIGKLEIDYNKLEIPIEARQYACVLNIYVNRVNFLENDIKSEAYYAMLKPLCHNLSVLISLKILYSKMIKDYNLAKSLQRKTNSKTEFPEVANG
ncbi:hypothetical protein [Vibrio jasicida]|jgi:multisubunit Na+/H+ antiporter MnhC subunit|uniref:hypothetical protein n=1 Tax=Vibrio jasicida TaxID=766224 RepID=UPI000CE370C5|nr:hypothetical protein [Vibrio jasicida]